MSNRDSDGAQQTERTHENGLIVGLAQISIGIGTIFLILCFGYMMEGSDYAASISGTIASVFMFGPLLLAGIAAAIEHVIHQWGW